MRWLVLAVSCVACERARPTPPAEPCPPLVDPRFETLGALAALWPGCPVDLPVESYAGRCLHGRHCMRPCRIERIDPAKDTPDDTEAIQYDAAGRMTAIHATTELGALPPLETRCRYAGDGTPLACGFAEHELAFRYANGRLAQIHETRAGAPYADEREVWDGDRLIASLRIDGDGQPEPPTTYSYDDGRLVAVRAGNDKTTLGYDEHGRVSRIVAAVGTDEPSTISLHYDDAGRVRERIDDMRAGQKRTTYRYDGDRLVEEDVAYGTVALYRTRYVYDCR